MSENSLERRSRNKNETSADKVSQNTDDTRSALATLTRLQETLNQVERELLELKSQLRLDHSMAQAAPVRRIWFEVLAWSVAVLIVAVRLYKLNTIQTDFYGDIQIVYQIVDSIRNGFWPYQYVLGVGPIYHYLIQPIILFTGLNYLGLKLSAVITSLGILLALFAFARKLVDDYFALLTVAIAGISSWLLIFSRLGISLILIPLLVTLALWLTIRFIQNQKPIDLIACAIISTMSLYSYPAGFILPLTFFITLLCLRWMGHPVSWKDLRLFVITSLIASLPFAWMVFQSPDEYIHGYIGSKFFAEGSAFQSLLHNIVSAGLAYHVKGDGIFRSNPIFQPHLDRLSGLLFLAGIVFWLQRERRRWSPILLVPFVLLHIPSVLVLGRPNEVPSAGRTLGVAPIAYILVASGIWLIVQFFTRMDRQRLGGLVAGLAFVVIFVLNMQRYFGSYISGLPYNDTSIGGRIAVYADSLPTDTQVYVVGCCWEASMPEVPFVQLVALHPENIRSLDPQGVSCDYLATLSEHAVLIWSFRDPLPAPQLEACKQWMPAQLYVSPKGLPVFHAAPLLRNQP